jgi:thioredoxin-related protein
MLTFIVAKLQDMQKLKPALFFCLIILSSATLNTGNTEKILWANVDQLSVKLKEQSRPVLIDLYTDWCYWCKVMDNNTYNNRNVINYINERFYSAKVNAETKDIITWKDRSYKYNNNYKVNDFALYLTRGQLSFPTTIIITDENPAPISIAGYLKPKEMEKVLKYFGEGAYKTKNFPEFEKTFKSTW